MKHTLSRDKYPRAHFWIDELPHARFDPHSHSTFELQPCRSLVPTCRIAAVEFRRIVGPYVPYALLGGELQEDPGSGLRITVNLQEEGPIYAEALNFVPENVSLGIPEDYLAGIVKATTRVAEVHGCPAGYHLTLNCAAHCRIGSSQHAFGVAAEVLLRMLTAPADLETHTAFLAETR